MINKILKYDLCIGCGLCESILGKDTCNMKINDKGFYEPVTGKILDRQEAIIIKTICPGIHIECDANKGVWGSMKYICEAWSTDKQIRYKAASGGVVTSLAVCLLEQQEVDAILQVGVKDGSYLHNELKISRTKDSILANAQSRYSPALVLSNIKKILDSSDDTYAFIGKPCDIAGMKNFLSLFPQYRSRIKFFISIFCAGMPSYDATIRAWQQSGHKDAPVYLKYRGDGWPGNFCARFKNGDEYLLSYNESWGKILGKSLGFRCKICPDGIGMLADIAIGDSWNTKDGYPDFTESEGKCFCMIRTNNGLKIMQDAQNKGYIDEIELDIDKIKEQQSYQYNRRKLEGWRLIPVLIMTGGLIRFKGLGIWRLFLKADFNTGIKNMIGTLKRMIKVKYAG